MSGILDVLLLFLIPIGGGIPAGVVLAHQKGIEWPVTAATYFVSDIILACIFEPMMHLIVKAGRHSQFFAKLHAAAKESTRKTLSLYGTKLGPMALVMISFGIDPMTGRAATAAAGHGFVSGWLLAIIGDMFYFALIMAATLWLSDILGDGTWATVIIMILMLGVPMIVRRIRNTRQKPI